MQPLASLFVDLPGTWKICRTISGTPMSGKLTGLAIFELVNPTTLSYYERGQFSSCTHSHKKIATTKHYLYKWLPEEQTISVLFNDHLSAGQLFHKLQFDPLQTLQANAIHHCGADTYNSIYAFANTPCGTFTVTHSVTGPTKDYCSTTVFQKNLS